jgi:circadian clock protein KaiB
MRSPIFVKCIVGLSREIHNPICCDPTIVFFPSHLFAAARDASMSNPLRKTYVLKLYVAGNTPNSIRALKTLNNILEKEFQGVYALKVIDVLKNPQLAEEDKILATPTLAKILPPPVRKIIGDLSDREKVLIGLDLLYEELRDDEANY